MCIKYFENPVKTIGKDVQKIINNPLPVLGAIAGNYFLPGLGYGISGLAGAAIGSGAGTLLSGGTPLQAAANAAGSYVGGSVAGNLIGDASNAVPMGPGGTVGTALGDNLGQSGSYAANMLPASIAGSTFGQLGSTAGTAAGTALGGGVANSLTGVGSSKGTGAPSITPGPWSTQSTMPSSLSGYAGLSPGQVSSNIATQGVYGGGQGPQEQDYFLNLINSRLNGDANTQLSPIEQSYLSQLGLGGSTSNQNLQSKLQAYQG